MHLPYLANHLVFIPRKYKYRMNLFFKGCDKKGKKKL